MPFILENNVKELQTWSCRPTQSSLPKVRATLITFAHKLDHLALMPTPGVVPPGEHAAVQPHLDARCASQWLQAVTTPTPTVAGTAAVRIFGQIIRPALCCLLTCRPSMLEIRTVTEDPGRVWFAHTEQLGKAGVEKKIK
jgi:hypothetical protein